MRRYWRSERPALFYAMRYAGEAVLIENGEGKRHALTPRGEKCNRIMERLGQWERHVPLASEALAAWKRELPLHGNSSYAAVLRRDIRLAEECNQRGDEMLVSFRRRGAQQPHRKEGE